MVTRVTWVLLFAGLIGACSSEQRSFSEGENQLNEGDSSAAEGSSSDAGSEPEPSPDTDDSEPESDAPEPEMAEPESDAPEPEMAEPESDMPEPETGTEPESDAPEPEMAEPESDMPEPETGTEPESDAPEPESSCGNGVINSGESCDDGNTNANDGCASDCSPETGFECDSAEPTICTAQCGDGLVVGTEQCDDEGIFGGDGCSATCKFEEGFECNGEPSDCSGVCGDGLLAGAEECDDGNTNSDDGCSATCRGETGWACSGEPSNCALTCGDGSLDSGESCDDGNTAAADGCSSSCQTEVGYSCQGEPSVCALTCGNGTLESGESCDDGATNTNDGCSPSCVVDSGWTCSGTPSSCSPECGDGMLTGTEQCDDGNSTSSDGCSSTCSVEAGWSCDGEPSNCTANCGNGALDSGEQCDDGDNSNGDGCSSTCGVEAGYSCSGTPSTCALTCGNGALNSGEGCDDGNNSNGDGCNSTCAVETGYSCSGTPSTCSPNCGNGTLDSGEQCDDGDNSNGDGCNSNCVVEADWSCSGQPSNCSPNCGNGTLDSGEQCDDGDNSNGDGCNSNCVVETDWVCSGEPSDCEEIVAPEITSFAASKTSVQGGGEQIQLFWSVNNADTLRIEATGMSDIGTVTSPPVNVTITADVTLTLVAENDFGLSDEWALDIQVNSEGVPDWAIQFGTTSTDSARDVAVDSNGNVFVVGETYGSMYGGNAGEDDAFVVKFDPDGNELWTRQLGSDVEDEASSVAVDSSGNVYMAGATWGGIDGSSSNTDQNCFFSKYNGSGAIQWVYQFDGSRCEVAVYGSNLYVAYGSGTNTYLRRYPLSGGSSPSWTRSTDFAQNSDTVTSVAADASGAYVVGNSFDTFGGGPATAMAYSSSGTKLWDEEWNGGSYTYLAGAAVSGGTLYVSGSIYGGVDLFADSAGFTDPFVAFHNTTNGTVSDGIQFGSSGYDSGRDVAIDARGNLLVVGFADGSFAAGSSGEYYVTKRNTAGDSLWLYQFGPVGTNGLVEAVAVSPNGMVFAVGFTDAELTPSPPGGVDAFIYSLR